MDEARNCANDAARAVCDGIRQIGDFSYAVMPRDLAHAVGDLCRLQVGDGAQEERDPRALVAHPRRDASSLIPCSKDLGS